MGAILAGLLIGVVAFAIYAVVMAIGSLIGAIFILPLWNWLMPELFGWTDITYWEAWGICWLCCLLFKSGTSSNNNN